MNRLKFFVGIALVILSLSGAPGVLLGAGSGEVDSLSGDPLFIKFHEKLEFYVDLKTRDFLQDLAAREKQLVQLLSSIMAETEARGLRTVTHNAAGFKTLYGISDSLIYEYNKELDAIIRIYNDLDKLEFNLRRNKDLTIWKELLVIKAGLEKAMADPRLESSHSAVDLTGSVLYSATAIDSLFDLYEALNTRRKLAISQQDSATVKAIDVERSQINRQLNLWGLNPPASETNFEQLVDQAEIWVSKMNDSDPLKKEQARQTKNELAKQVTLVDRLDQGLEDLMTDDGYDTLGNPTLTHIIDEWKAARMTDFKLRLSEYQIIHETLIDSATTQERDRMLSREVGDALFNYANQNYLLAEHQLDYMLKVYGHHYKGLDPLIFYRSETQYARGYVDLARDGYLKILENAPGSPYRTESLLRLMQIAQKNQDHKSFYEFFDLLKSFAATANQQEMEAAYYLAANQMFNDKRFTEAEETLLMMNEKSPYYLSAQLLLATVYNNLDNYSQAIIVLEKLAGLVNYPWTDQDVANYRNSALVRLGLIYYQRGEFDRALGTFEKVSKGYQDRDKALIGAAWAELKSGNYGTSSEKSSALVTDYSNSSYIYEAMVLAAHCRRIMDQPDLARESLRYVAGAYGAREMGMEYRKERDNLLAQKSELTRIQNQILETRNETLYPEIVRIRDSIDATLFSVRQRSDRGAMIQQDYLDERNFALKRLKDLDEIVEQALNEGRDDLAQEAAKQRARLLKVLETYQVGQDVANSSYLVEYPLAAKEAEVLYTKEVIKSMTRDLETEKNRLEQALKEMQTLSQVKQNRVDVSKAIDIEMLEYDMDNLRNRISQLRVWLQDHEPEAMVTNFEKWADYSGYGMLDLSYDGLEKRTERINQLWEKVAVIDSVFTKKQNDLAQMIESYDQEFKKLQKVLEQEKNRVEMEQRKYEFENLYFDNKERETESWEARYERLLQLKKQEN